MGSHPGPHLGPTFLQIMTVGILITSGCARSGNERFTVTMEEGVSVATTTGGPLFEGPLFTLEKILTLREDPDRPESLMTRAIRFGRGANGHFYVPDAGASCLFQFDENGVFVRRIGRPGEGPGEFQSVGLPVFLKDGFWVWDYQGRRSTRFSLDGVLQEVVRPPTDRMLVDMQPLPGGSGWFLRDVSSRSEGTVGYMGLNAAVVDVDGDTLMQAQTELRANAYMETFELAPDNVVTRSRHIPYTGSSTLLHLPGRGVLVAQGDTPDMTWYDYSGAAVLRIRTGLTARAVTPSVRSAFEERARAALQARAEERGRAPERLPEYRYPERSWFWSWGTVDETGWIWLLDTWDEYERGYQPGGLFHVIDPEGRFMGTVDLPTSRPVIQDGLLLANMEDPETGALIPTVYRLHPREGRFTYP